MFIYNNLVFKELDVCMFTIVCVLGGQVGRGGKSTGGYVKC